MSWVELAIAVIGLIVKIWDAVKENNDEKKKKQTEAIQSGIRGIIDRDPSRIAASFDTIRRVRGL